MRELRAPSQFDAGRRSSAYARQTHRVAASGRQGLRPRLFKAKDQLEQDEIAARQCWALQAFQGSRNKKPLLTDVKEMFLQMRDHA
jgi:hypothetical protein